MSHALLSFVEEENQPTSIVPLARILDGHRLKKGDLCSVEWTDKKFYSPHILAKGECFLHNYVLKCVHEIAYCKLTHLAAMLFCDQQVQWLK